MVIHTLFLWEKSKKKMLYNIAILFGRDEPQHLKTTGF